MSAQSIQVLYAYEFTCIWRRKVMRDATLKSLKYADLYERLFDQSSEKASSQDLYNVLLLVLLVMTYAVDTSICEPSADSPP